PMPKPTGATSVSPYCSRSNRNGAEPFHLLASTGHERKTRGSPGLFLHGRRGALRASWRLRGERRGRRCVLPLVLALLRLFLFAVAALFPVRHGSFSLAPLSRVSPKSSVFSRFRGRKAIGRLGPSLAERSPHDSFDQRSRNPAERPAFVG